MKAKHRTGRLDPVRDLGQVWTPDWVADAMAQYVLLDSPALVFDPAVGAAALLRAVLRTSAAQGKGTAITGTEIDSQVLDEAIASGLPKSALPSIRIGDFLLTQTPEKVPAVIANPPYLRHHKIAADVKRAAQALCMELIGESLDARAGLHVYFLVKALGMLEDGGRLAFIMPADTVEGIFAKRLWDWITTNYCLEGVATFSPTATPFPGVDTNAVVFLIRKAPPLPLFGWVECLESDTPDLAAWMRSPHQAPIGRGVRFIARDLEEAKATGLSRDPVMAEQSASRYLFGDFAKAMRGVATGANHFFYLTPEEADRIGVPADLLVPTVVRTRDVQEEEITECTLSSLEEKGRPTRLLYLEKTALEALPPAVQIYITAGEAEGIHERALAGARTPWYSVERRDPPPILFAYLGRRNTRFMRNRVGVIPSHGFLCVYLPGAPEAVVEAFWDVLRHPDTTANLKVVGKSYGNGAIKVEPRALERLPLPEYLIETSPVLMNYLAERQG